MEYIDHQRELKLRPRDQSKNARLFDPMELIEAITVKAVAIPYEIYEAAVDATISDTYWCDYSEVDTYNTGPEDWILVKDPIRHHISSIDAKYYPDLLESALNTRLQTSEFAAFWGWS